MSHTLSHPSLDGLARVSLYVSHAHLEDQTADVSNPPENPTLSQRHRCARAGWKRAYTPHRVGLTETPPYLEVTSYLKRRCRRYD